MPARENRLRAELLRFLDFRVKNYPPEAPQHVYAKLMAAKMEIFRGPSGVMNAWAEAFNDASEAGLRHGPTLAAEAHAMQAVIESMHFQERRPKAKA